MRYAQNPWKNNMPVYVYTFQNTAVNNAVLYTRPLVIAASITQHNLQMDQGHNNNVEFPEKATLRS